MNAYRYITGRQILWAQRRGIRLGSQFRNSPDIDMRSGGRALFVYDLRDNLFEAITDEARRAFEDGDGGELHRDKPSEGNMYALHSSSAAACNLFHYWHRRGELAPLARALGLPSTGISGFSFEARHVIVERDSRFPRAPNLDAALTYERGVIRAAAIECKFTEPYGRPHEGLADSYLELEDKWEGLSNLRALGELISPRDDRFRHLHAAQLLKHVLGLATTHGPGHFRLLYLWYEPPGAEARVHQDEIDELSGAARADGVDFRSLTYQDAIVRLARVRSDHPEYVDYLAERYL